MTCENACREKCMDTLEALSEKLAEELERAKQLTERIISTEARSLEDLDTYIAVLSIFVDELKTDYINALTNMLYLTNGYLIESDLVDRKLAYLNKLYTEENEDFLCILDRISVVLVKCSKCN